MTQRELAESLELSPRSVQAWEEGAASPYRRIAELEALLQRSGAWILHGREEPLSSASSGSEPPLGSAERRELVSKFAEIDRRLLELERRVGRVAIAVGALRGVPLE
jgi:transcriptional regulator with XRE-family HTH domain